MDSIILGVGAGRDGTTSLCKLIESIFELNGHSGKSVHQKDHVSLYNEFCLLKETEDRRHYENMREIIQEWRRGDGIIGNGYAHCLELIYDIHGPAVKIIHLRRQKASWIDSFKKNVRTFPWSHGNYSNESSARIMRIGAFHFGEMSREQWQALSLEERLCWYYDKTHALISEAESRFNETLGVATEALSKAETVQHITRFLEPKWRFPETGLRVNVSRVDYEALDEFDRVIVNRAYSEFDYVRAAREPLVGEHYFAEKVVDGFVHRDCYEHSTVSEHELRKYEKRLKQRLAEVRRLLEEAGG